MTVHDALRDSVSYEYSANVRFGTCFFTCLTRQAKLAKPSGRAGRGEGVISPNYFETFVFHSKQMSSQHDNKFRQATMHSDTLWRGAC